jgi:hypothetical protein
MQFRLPGPRVFLRCGAVDLARASRHRTVRRASVTEGETSTNAPNELAVHRALEAAGVAWSYRTKRWCLKKCTRPKSTEQFLQWPALETGLSPSGNFAGKNWRIAAEEFSIISVTFRHVRCELSTHGADKAYAVGIKNSRS